jgi:molecular chaperone DnaK (HSP70)
MGRGSPSGTIHRIPTLIYYSEKNDPAIGNEVLLAGCADHHSTARWIRSYLLEGNGAQIQAGGGRQVTFRDAASDLLRAVLLKVVTKHPDLRSVVFSIPDEAPHGYGDWLVTVSQTAGLTDCHTIGECSAAAAGYGLVVDQGQLFIHFSCDETSLGLQIVRNGGLSGNAEMEVIGSARSDTGTCTMDRWIAEEIVVKSRLVYHGGRERSLHRAALTCAAEVCENLSKGDEAVAEFSDPVSGRPVSVRITTADIVRLFDDHALSAILDDIIRRARGAAQASGYNGETPSAILMTGRGSALRAIQALIQERFSGVAVLSDRPFDAIARGACLNRSRMPGPNRIRNSYALRYWDPVSREHRYRFLVHSGARFPSAGQAARITISAAYDGQARLGLSLYEMGEEKDGTIPALELIRDPAGGVRIATPAEDAGGRCMPVLVNGSLPLLLTANPPGVKGEPRFELTFTIDTQRQLCLTARDLITGTLVRRDTPVYRLT